MNIAKRVLASALTLIPVVAAIAPTAAAAENGQKNASARRQSQTVSTSRVTPGTQKRAIPSSGQVKLPGRIEYPNLTASRRSTDRAQLEPTSMEYPNVIESVGARYTMIRRSRNGGADAAKNTGAERRSVPASGDSHLRPSKTEVSIETLAADRVKRNAYWLPEVGDEVLAARQSDNPSSRMPGNQLRTRR
jgi:hypothetical protein